MHSVFSVVQQPIGSSKDEENVLFSFYDSRSAKVFVDEFNLMRPHFQFKVSKFNVYHSLYEFLVFGGQHSDALMSAMFGYLYDFKDNPFNLRYYTLLNFIINQGEKAVYILERNPYGWPDIETFRRTLATYCNREDWKKPSFVGQFYYELKDNSEKPPYIVARPIVLNEVNRCFFYFGEYVDILSKCARIAEMNVSYNNGSNRYKAKSTFYKTVADALAGGEAGDLLNHMMKHVPADSVKNVWCGTPLDNIPERIRAMVVGK